MIINMTGCSSGGGSSSNFNNVIISPTAISENSTLAEGTMYINYDSLSSNIDLTKTSFTEEEFIGICKNNLQSQMKIGDTITLSNSSTTYGNTYRVIGINHDGTSNTVDIMSDFIVNKLPLGSSGSYFDVRCYETGPLRKWLNGTFITSFSDTIQSLAKPIKSITYTGSSSFGTTYDLVKIPSAKEMNLTTYNQYMPAYDTSKSVDEGNPYPFFTAGAYDDAISNRIRTNSNISTYWTRTMKLATSSSDVYQAWYVLSTGVISTTIGSSNNGVVAILRF